MSNNSIVVNSFNSIITDTIVNILTTCRSESKFNNNITIKCQNKHLRENNSQCLRLLTDFNVQQYDTQLSVDSSNYQRVIQDFQMALSNITLNSCKGCLYDNIQQNMLFSLDSTCSTEQITNNTIQAMATETVDNTLDNHGDLMSGLAGALGFSTSSQIKQEMSTRISTLIGEDILNESLTQVTAYQNMEFSARDVQYINQNTVIDVINTIVINTDISNQVLSDSEWKIINELINDQSSISDIGDMYLTQLNVLNALAKTVMGRVILAVCVLAGIVMLLFLVMNGVVYGPDIWNSLFVKPTSFVIDSFESIETTTS